MASYYMGQSEQFCKFGKKVTVLLSILSWFDLNGVFVLIFASHAKFCIFYLFMSLIFECLLKLRDAGYTSSAFAVTFFILTIQYCLMDMCIMKMGKRQITSYVFRSRVSNFCFLFFLSPVEVVAMFVQVDSLSSSFDFFLKWRFVLFSQVECTFSITNTISLHLHTLLSQKPLPLSLALGAYHITMYHR